MQGLHLTADLRACAPATALMRDVAALRELCLGAVTAAGLQPVGEIFRAFPAPGGITGVVLLAESHLAVHTWPELGGVTLDIYVCNRSQDNSAKAQALMTGLEAVFAPRYIERHRLRRGESTVGDPQRAA